MHILDNPHTYTRYDSANMRSSIAALPLQCAQAWEESRALFLPSSYRRNIDQVIVAGMGGSALGGHTIASIFSDRLPVPLTVVSDYTLPRSVTRHSVVILSSYSGSTEETIASAKEAVARKARVIGITTGGPLASFLKRKQLPCYQFIPRHNSCGQPRMGLGYSLFGQLGFLHALGILRLSSTEIREVSTTLAEAIRAFTTTVPVARNPAKRAAEFLHNTIPVLIGPTALSGALHIFANQMNENAKTFTAFFALPELNHHLIEGLRLPDSAHHSLRWIIFTHSSLSPRMQRRTHITETILRKQRFRFFEQALLGTTPFAAAASLLAFGSYTSFYLALLNHIDPSAIPWVTYLKQQLART